MVVAVGNTLGVRADGANSDDDTASLGSESIELPEGMKRYLKNSIDVETPVGGDMPIHPEDDSVASFEALQALRYCKYLLSSSRNQDRPWQHPQELLDASAGALDEAALALKAGDWLPEDMEELKALSKEIKEGRHALLEAAAGGIDQTVYNTCIQDERNSTTLIVYATHTGTAKIFAKKLQKSLEDADIVNIKNLTLASVAERKRVYFISSTFGLGRPPRSSELFLSSLQLQKAPGRVQKPLDGVDVAVAALGNSDFADFAAFGRVLARELELLGAKHLIDVTTMDAKGGFERQTKEFQAWQGKVLQLEGKNFKRIVMQSKLKGKKLSSSLKQSSMRGKSLTHLKQSSLKGDHPAKSTERSFMSESGAHECCSIQ